MSENVLFRLGVPEALRSEAAELYEQAFGAKFAVAVRDTDARRRLITSSLVLANAVCAIENEGLIGVAGFKTTDGSLTGGLTVRRLFSHLGFFHGLWATLIFGLYERSLKPGELLLDGISVRPEQRGRGIGGRLLDELRQYAREHGYKSIRLDVIDTNPRARQLYERKGFVATRTEHFAYLRWLLGFGASTTMILQVYAAASTTHQTEKPAAE